MGERNLQVSEEITRPDIKAVLDELFAGCQDKNAVENQKNILLNEIDPANDKLFGLEIGGILENVDLATGSEDFRKLKNMGLSKECKDETQNAFVHSGIKYVYERIKHYLIDSNIAKNVFVEYSLLPSTLDPNSTGKLQCMSFIVGEDEFKKKIKECYTACIAKTREEYDGISLYDHPDFLYNIPIEDVKKGEEIKASNDNVVYNGRGLRFSRIRAEKLGNLDVDVLQKADSGYKIVEDEGVDIGAFDLDRSFDEMLSTAKRFAEERQGLTEEQKQKRSLTAIHEKLHRYCHENISTRGGKCHQSVYVSFPIFGARADNQLTRYKIVDGTKTALQGIGACFIFFEPKELPKADEKKDVVRKWVLDRIIGKITYEICTFIRFASANYLLNLGLQLQDKARKEALKSAKSAIMSRNMSHNLGSHVMSYLKQSLSSVNNIFRDKILSLLIQDVNNLAIDNEIKEAKEKGDQGVLPFLVGLGQFISYIQERQDFIATIATDYIPYLSTVNFKDFIYDELNPDKRYERHKTKQRLKIDNILLGNIARSEGLGRTTSPTNEQTLSNIILKFRDFDGEPVEQQDKNGQPLGKAMRGREKEFATLKDMRAYDFSLPGGVVGRQAVFSIVENVIRNAAKHGNWRDKGELVLEFNLFTKQSVENTPKGDSYLDDNENGNLLSLRQVFEKFYINACDSKDLYFITLTDNLSIDEDKLEKLRKAINEPLINERGEMNEASKGMKEMRISSTWIRSLNEGETYNPIKYAKDGTAIPENKWDPVGKEQYAPSLYARISNGHLQYVFCVLRPKKIAIISTQFAKDGDEDVLDIGKFNENVFQIKSWAAFTPKQYCEERNKSYEFVLFDDINGVSKEKKYQYEALRNISSTRFWKLSDIIKNTESQEFFKCIESMSDEDINYIQTSLYRKLSDFNEGDIIYVDDKTASANDELRIKESEKGDNPYRTSEHVKVDDGIKGQGDRLYIYRSHHDTKDRYEAFVKSVNDGDYQGNLFVEGITGNNSTDRLVRNEKLDDVWFYKHLHAMKETVAIFDERLFSKIMGFEEAQLKDVAGFKIDTSNRKEYKERYKKEILKNDLNEIRKFRSLSISQQDTVLEETFKKEKGGISFKEKEEIKGILPIVFKQKGIYIFTLIQEQNPDERKSFNLYGLKIENELKSCKCIKLSTLSWDEAGLHFSGEMINGKMNSYKKFDRISIHQGLLDKLYEVFNIKDKPEEKKKLTTQLHEKFSSLSDVEEQVQKPNEAEEKAPKKIEVKDFLPGLCVHSGRSKPSKTDMPQQLPFIQYAAIENAVLDCKYSLVELLDFARYE